MSMNLETMKGLNAFHLANRELADCGSPDSRDSAGAKLLLSVRDAVAEEIERDPAASEDDLKEAMNGIADSAPSIYTAPKWEQFVDLAAYQEEPELADSWPNDLDNAASLALCQIADRLVHRLIQEYIDWRDEQDDDELS